MRSKHPAPIVNPALAAAFSNEPNPVEKLADIQNAEIAHTAIKVGDANSLRGGKRPAKLVCGHYVMTSSLKRAACPRCGEMIRSGYDYDGFRNLGNPDEFSWPDDPLRTLNENMIADE